VCSRYPLPRALLGVALLLITWTPAESTPRPLAQVLQEACRLGDLKEADAHLLQALEEPETIQLRDPWEVYQAHLHVGACYGHEGPLVPELRRSQTRLWEVLTQRASEGERPIDTHGFDQLVRLNPVREFPVLVKRFGRFVDLRDRPRYSNRPVPPHPAEIFSYLLASGVSGEAAVRTFEALAFMTTFPTHSGQPPFVSADDAIAMVSLLPEPDRLVALRRVVHDVRFQLCDESDPASSSCAQERFLTESIATAFGRLTEDRATFLATDLLLSTQDSWTYGVDREVINVRFLTTLVGVVPPAPLLTILGGIQHRIAPGRNDTRYPRSHAERITDMIGAAREAGWADDQRRALQALLEAAPTAPNEDLPPEAGRWEFVRTYAGMRVKREVTDREEEGEFGLFPLGLRISGGGTFYQEFHLKQWRNGAWVRVATIYTADRGKEIWSFSYTLRWRLRRLFS
jgi:hypothetical protein